MFRQVGSGKNSVRRDLAFKRKATSGGCADPGVWIFSGGRGTIWVPVMIEKLLALIDRCDSFIVTTHDPADADGIGAQLTLACILGARGKRFRIINASPVPERFGFMDASDIIEQWDRDRHGTMAGQSALIIVDTADENHMGQMKEAVAMSREVFVIDHHERKSSGALNGIYDATAASTCELAVELAEASGAAIDSATAFAAYVGIVYDTGFFAYPKVGPRTFDAAQKLLRLGANPSDAYRRLCESLPMQALRLQQRSISSLAFHHGNRTAVQVLRQEDFAETGAISGDTDGFVNFPLRTREVAVSFLIKHTLEGKVCCSLRSKGGVNVAKIAQEFGGGGILTLPVSEARWGWTRPWPRRSPRYRRPCWPRNKRRSHEKRPYEEKENRPDDGRLSGLRRRHRLLCAPASGGNGTGRKAPHACGGSFRNRDPGSGYGVAGTGGERQQLCHKGPDGSG